MGKFMKYGDQARAKPRPWKIHPLWQGIGCIMMLLIPLISYAGAYTILQANQVNKWFEIPSDFYGPPGQRLLYSNIFGAVLLSVLGYILFVIFYMIMYRFIGPPRYGPTDAPPPKGPRRGQKYSR